MELLKALILTLVVGGFFLGGELSPLWTFKTYQKFMYSIGMTDKKGEE